MEIYYQESDQQQQQQQQSTFGHINQTFSMDIENEVAIDIEDGPTGSMEMKQTELTVPVVDEKDFKNVNLESEENQ